MSKPDILTLLTAAGAILRDDHFVLTSGRHSPLYINKDAAYVNPANAARIGELFAEAAPDTRIDVVAAPALGGIILSQWTAYHLGKLRKKDILSVYTEKTPEKDQIFTRGYDAVVKGKNALVIEDLTTTGGSVQKVVESVRKAGGTVAAVGVMVNRDPETVTEKLFAAPFYSLATLPVTTYPEEDCPMCQKQLPINTQVGHGNKYLSAHK